MKKEIHPENYRPVIFHDNTSGEQFLIASCVKTEEKGKWTDGKEYPLYRVEISSASHPFYTGRATVVDTAGRVERFKKRSQKSEEVKKTRATVKTKEEKRAEKKKKETQGKKK